MKKECTQYIEVESLDDALRDRNVDMPLFVSSNFFLSEKFTVKEKLIWITMRALLIDQGEDSVTMSQLSQLTDLNRVEIYAAITSLEKKGALMVSKDENNAILGITIRNYFDKGNENE